MQLDILTLISQAIFLNTLLIPLLSLKRKVTSKPQHFLFIEFLDL